MVLSASNKFCALLKPRIDLERTSPRWLCREGFVAALLLVIEPPHGWMARPGGAFPRGLPRQSRDKPEEPRTEAVTVTSRCASGRLKLRNSLSPLSGYLYMITIMITIICNNNLNHSGRALWLIM